MQVTVIAVAGGSGSGKTTFARRFFELMGNSSCLVLSQDSYYIDQSARFTEDGGEVNFDHPSSLDFELLARHLRELKSGESVRVPRYDFATHTRSQSGEPVMPRPVVVVDGTLVLSQEVLLPLFDWSVFLQVPDELRFERRLKRDMAERGRTRAGVQAQWDNHVAPMYRAFVAPSACNATFVAGDGESIESCLERLLIEVGTL